MRLVGPAPTVAAKDAKATLITAELTVEDGRLVLEPVRAPRQGWAAVFAAASGALTAEDHDWLGGPLAGDA